MQMVSHIISSGDREIILIGSAHISQASVTQVKETIEREKPDTVCIELCQSRFDAISGKNQWQEQDIFKVVKENKTALLLINLILSSFQKRLGEDVDVSPGQEMLEAFHVAKAQNAKVMMADRPIEVTLKRSWRMIPSKEKPKVFLHFFPALFNTEKVNEEQVEQLKSQDILSEAIREFESISPTLKEVVVDERDQYLANKILQAQGKKVVAVIGAGHLKGVKKYLESKESASSIHELEELPHPSVASKLIKWGIPTVIIGLFIYGFLKVDLQQGYDLIWRWVLINGGLSALGAILALAHPITIISAFIAAPITSLNPMIAAGWVVGFVELYVRRPQVKDFESLSGDILSFSGFWKNKITRILLVVIFANLGSSMGTFIGGASIIDQLFPFF